MIDPRPPGRTCSPAGVDPLLFRLPVWNPASGTQHGKRGSSEISMPCFVVTVASIQWPVRTGGRAVELVGETLFLACHVQFASANCSRDGRMRKQR